MVFSVAIEGWLLLGSLELPPGCTSLAQTNSFALACGKDMPSTVGEVESMVLCGHGLGSQSGKCIRFSEQ